MSVVDVIWIKHSAHKNDTGKYMRCWKMTGRQNLNYETRVMLSAKEEAIHRSGDVADMLYGGVDALFGLRWQSNHRRKRHRAWMRGNLVV